MKTTLEFRVWSLEFRAGAFIFILLCNSVLAGSDPYRGLWVGQAKLSFVNEVSIPLDENNVPIAPDPNVPTPTADQAQIRLILHVNGAGQVNLLKDVAIMRRSEPNETNQYFASEADLALVTDESLYSDFPSQMAKRIASAVFDFGDVKGTEALDAIVQQVSDAVAESMMGSVNKSAAAAAAIVAADPIVSNADVAESFDAFLKDKLSKADVTAIVEAADPAVAIETLRSAAEALVDHSFYNDTRATNVLDSLKAAINSAVTPEDKEAAAQNAVARYADVENLYKRYVSGVVFGDMIREVALAAATEASNTGTTRVAIDNQARIVPMYAKADMDSVNAKVSAYTDTASQDALKSVVSNMVNYAYSKSSTPVGVTKLAAELEATGFAVLATLQHSLLSINIPTADYTVFVRSSDFAEAVSIAADAAAAAALAETKADPFYTEFSLEGKARIGATLALTSIYSEAARSRQNELPLAGVFEQGSGDPRLISFIELTDAPLGGAGLSGTIILPANHPTNPFRHRRHPDHTVGFDIERRLRFDFDGVSTNALDKTGLGVERITGIYREEIFGLHKPLGP